MTVVLNEAALEALFNSPESPVAQFVARKAGQVVEGAQQNLRDYFHTAPSLTVDQDVVVQMDGSSARVGIRDAGAKSRRMAQAQADGNVNWLTGALEDAFSG